MNDPELKRVGIFVGAGLVGVAILNSVYQAGVSAGMGRDGRYVDHDGLFPFPLLLFGGLAFFFWWRRRNGHGGGPGNGGGMPGRGFGRGPGGPPRFFEEWHRQAHGMTPPAAPAPQAPAAPSGPAAGTAPPADPTAPGTAAGQPTSQAPVEAGQAPQTPQPYPAPTIPSGGTGPTMI